ncbi:MAG: COG1361 family protein, partial [Planctomycetota bacterium]
MSLPVLAAIVLATVAMTPALPAIARLFTPSSLFEIDENAVDENDANPGKEGDDWDTVLTGGGGESFESFFVVDFENTSGYQDDIFTGGGSKDELDIPNWMWKFQAPPDKDDFTNVYAAFYSDTNGDFVAYFGADRLATNGDSNIGIWFLQNEVGQEPDGTFSGSHMEGDVLIVAEFTKGGGLATPLVFVWDTSEPDNLRQEALLGGEVLAAVNEQSETAPWTYFFKSGGISQSATFPKGAFFEGCINLSAILSSTPCFATVIFETRSSQSTDAVLKDLAVGQVDICGLSITKTPNFEGVCEQDNAQIEYTYEVCNTGVVPLFVNVDDDNATPLNLADDIDIDMGDGFVLQPMGQAGDCMTFMSTGPLPDLGDPPYDVTNTAVAIGYPLLPGTQLPDLTASPIEAMTDATVRVEDCRIVVTKDCTDASAPGQPIMINGTVSNPGSVPLTNVSISDDPVANFTVQPPSTINPGESYPWVGSFTPALADLDENCEIEDEITATATADSADVEVDFKSFGVIDKDKATCGVNTAPSIDVDVVCPTTDPKPGEMYMFTGTVENDGNVPLKDVSVTVNGASVTLASTTLAVGSGPQAFSGMAMAPSLACDFTLDAQASATADPDCNDDDTGGIKASDLETCGVDTSPSIVVTLACPEKTPAPGEDFTFTGTVENTGDVPLKDVAVVVNGANMVLTSTTLAVGSGPQGFSETFTALSDACSYTLDATASATADPDCNLDGPGGITNTDSVTCPIGTGPAIEVLLSCPTTPATPGDPFTFTGTVENKGDVPLK